ncbi:MAG: hypothetical protein QOE36_722 [Gaiellaceae bacterium]|nr:hypothetical protein [Gaiellaceae bacterium]
MAGMHAGFLFEIVFAGAVVLAAVALDASALERLPRLGMAILAGAIGAAAVAAWVAFALDPSARLAVDGGGLLACTLVVLAGIPLSAAIVRNRRVEAEFARAEQRLSALVEKEAVAQASELERTLARARADSLSLLTEEERRIAEARRSSLVEREERAGDDLAIALAGAQRRVEERLAQWNLDLERAQQALDTKLAVLAERQNALITDAESRLRADVGRLEGETEEQREALHRLRLELAKSTEEARAEATAELETQAVERRRAVDELDQRLRRRERVLAEQIEREEADIRQQLKITLSEVARRQTEELERVVGRTVSSFSEAAAVQFSDAIKGAREDAAKRLSRELDRAVQTFVREAQTVLEERMNKVGDAGAQRLEARLAQLGKGFERQRDVFIADLERRLGEVEDDLRARMEGISSDTEAERGVLEARLHELARRIDEAALHAEQRLAALESLRTS